MSLSLFLEQIVNQDGEPKFLVISEPAATVLEWPGVSRMPTYQGAGLVMGAFEPPGSKTVETPSGVFHPVPTGKIYENESLLSKGAYRRLRASWETLKLTTQNAPQVLAAVSISGKGFSKGDK